jgi:hypothetical protein
VGASVVPGGDAAPVLELGEHVLDPVALLVERLVIGQRDFPAFGGGDAGLAAPFGESVPEPIAVVAAIGKERLGWRQGIEDQPRAFVIAQLAFGEQQNEGRAFAVADSVEL